MGDTGNLNKTMSTFLLRLYESTTLKLVLVAFILYNANLRSITSFDTNPTRYLPISILEEFDLDLDEFPFLHRYPERRLHQQGEPGEEFNDPPYWIRHVRGHHMSTYPVMPAILSVPVYAVPVLLGLTDNSGSAIGFSQTEIVGTALSKITASLVMALSVGILYLALLRLTSRRYALWIAIVYGFATSSWAVSSQGLWQSSMSQPCLAIALYFFVKARENGRYVIYASVPLALSVACRQPTIVFAVVMFIYVLRHYRDRAAYFVIFPTVIGALLLTYNLYYFGHWMGGYYNLGANLGVESAFSYPGVEGFLGLLISPNRGLLVFSPVLVLACVALVSTLYHRLDPLLIYTALATLMIILFYSTWGYWGGGFSFGDRFLVDTLPGFTILSSVFYERIFAHQWTKAVFLVLFGFSVAVQIIGAFFYPCDWQMSPVPAHRDPRRYWDWRDTQIVRCLCSGPVDPEGLHLLRQAIVYREPTF